LRERQQFLSRFMSGLAEEIADRRFERVRDLLQFEDAGAFT
jgi:hypothetical protein